MTAGLPPTESDAATDDPALEIASEALTVREPHYLELERIANLALSDFKLDGATEAIVNIRQVVKYFDARTCVLRGLDFQVARREFVFITGVSGAGKSTLLRLLYGAERPTRGTVQVAGMVVSDLRSRSLALFRRRIGVVFQDYQLLPNRTVAENVAFVLRAQGLRPSDVRRRVEPALNLVELWDKRDRFPRTLSGGEQQRASLARAIANSPVLLLADEPTGNLDRENSLRVLHILERLNACGIATVVTTHDSALLEPTCHRVENLSKGALHRVR
ncbi:MAG: ATP-binding cassette domain-containing protein [Cyanobacteria bacterium P01_D01_bin.123]